MKVKELKAELERFDGETNIDCNDCDGIYTTIKGLKEQTWTDRDGMTHKSVTIMHSGYHSADSVVKTIKGEENANETVW